VRGFLPRGKRPLWKKARSDGRLPLKKKKRNRPSIRRVSSSFLPISGERLRSSMPSPQGEKRREESTLLLGRKRSSLHYLMENTDILEGHDIPGSYRREKNEERFFRVRPLRSQKETSEGKSSRPLLHGPHA